VLRLLQDNELRLPIVEAAVFWAAGQSSDPGSAVTDFFHDRLGVQLRESGIRYDYVQASASSANRLDADMLRVGRRAQALQGLLTSDTGANLLAGYKRAANILKKEDWTPTAQGALTYTALSEEAQLIAALDAAEPRARAAVETENFEGAMAALASLRAPVDAFFDKVTVNDPEPAKREARLNLLARMRDAVHEVADFSRIEG